MGLSRADIIYLTELSNQSKFEEIRKSNQAAAQRFAGSQFSSSDEDDEEVDEEQNGKHGKIVASTFTTYTHQTGALRLMFLAL